MLRPEKTAAADLVIIELGLKVFGFCYCSVCLPIKPTKATQPYFSLPWFARAIFLSYGVVVWAIPPVILFIVFFLFLLFHSVLFTVRKVGTSSTSVQEQE